MKNKNRLLIIIVVLLLVVAALVTGNHYTTLRDNESNFAVRDTASVTKIFIADNNVYESLLERTNRGWVLNKKFPANKKAVEFFLETLKKIRVKAPVSKAAESNVIKRLAGTAVKVEIYQRVPYINLFNRIKLFYHEKLTKVFFVGGATQNNLGTYMLMDGAEHPYIVYIPGFRGFVSVRFTPKPDDWKSHVVFNHKLSNIKSVEVDNFQKPEESFRVTVEDAMGNYQITRLSDNAKITDYDTLKLLNFLTSFRDLKYESRLNNLLPPERIDSIINSKPIYNLLLVDVHNDTTKVIIYKKNRFPDEVNNAFDEFVPVDLDRFYGLINKGEDFVLMQYYVFDKVLRPLDYYIKKE